MGTENGEPGRPPSHGGLPQVLCAACGSKFEMEGVETGARVRCPLCGETVEVAELVASKRRYRSRTHHPIEGGRRISKTTYRRSLRVVVVAAVIAGAAVALWCGVLADLSRR